ncbi:MAG: class I SAM-dependent methyltransferase [Candidatus Acidiferrales bacterium]
MTTTNATADKAGERKIEYLSRPAEVSMTDGYFELASLEHFWIRRRFAVFQKLAGGLIAGAREMAEVGCGRGLLQRQVELEYERELVGFDLNENGLKHNLSQFSRVCCYDIHQMLDSLRARFDLIFLWDVLEHISDEGKFLQALLFHLAPGGRLVVNVPAGRWAYSSYDRAAGHVRRYSIETLREVAERNQLELLKWSYWGLPLVPVLFARKLRRVGQDGGEKAYAAGFDTRTVGVNAALGMVARCEVIPQKLFGTSLMAVLQVEKN